MNFIPFITRDNKTIEFYSLDLSETEVLNFKKHSSMISYKFNCIGLQKEEYEPYFNINVEFFTNN